jgi:hypothetical protein
MYRQLTIIQIIAFKGWIKHPETRPKGLEKWEALIERLKD